MLSGLVFKNRRFKLVLILSVVFLTIFWKLRLKHSKSVQSSYNNESEKRKAKHAICIVLTSEKTITTRGVAVWDTWGKDCKTTFACNCKNVKKYNQLATQNEIIPDNLKKYSIVANYSILYLDVDEDYNKMVKLIS